MRRLGLEIMMSEYRMGPHHVVLHKVVFQRMHSRTSEISFPGTRMQADAFDFVIHQSSTLSSAVLV